MKKSLQCSGGPNKTLLLDEFENVCSRNYVKNGGQKNLHLERLLEYISSHADVLRTRNKSKNVCAGDYNSWNKER